jgi:hypothetical protein
MVLKDFGQVGEVVFPHLPLEIVQHMIHSRRLPSVIERSSIIRKDKNEGSAWLQHSAPFFQRLDRICEVFQAV